MTAQMATVFTLHPAFEYHRSQVDFELKSIGCHCGKVQGAFEAIVSVSDKYFVITGSARGVHLDEAIDAAYRIAVQKLQAERRSRYLSG